MGKFINIDSKAWAIGVTQISYGEQPITKSFDDEDDADLAFYKTVIDSGNTTI